VAVALTLTVFETVAPFVGAVIETVGGVVSGPVLGADFPLTTPAHPPPKTAELTTNKNRIASAARQPDITRSLRKSVMALARSAQEHVRAQAAGHHRLGGRRFPKAYKAKDPKGLRKLVLGLISGQGGLTVRNCTARAIQCSQLRKNLRTSWALVRPNGNSFVRERFAGE
jgi:hypothetical protein